MKKMDQPKIFHNIMKKIIFIFSGESRCNPLSHNNNNASIIDSYNKNIFNEEFKSSYKYKICISTDDIHLHNTVNYFGNDNIMNIHLLNTGHYYKYANPINNIQYYIDKYNNVNRNNCQTYLNTVFQYYKLYDAYNLIDEDCDYIVRMRFDTCVIENIINLLNQLEQNPELKLIIKHDVFAIGRKDIMSYYCQTINNKFGEYNYNTVLKEPPNICMEYNELDKTRWTYAAETQVYETLFEYCNMNNLIINNAIKYIDCCFIIR